MLPRSPQQNEQTHSSRHAAGWGKAVLLSDFLELCGMFPTQLVGLGDIATGLPKVSPTYH